jgi:hypothetical protein
MIFPFFCPRSVVILIASPEETKNPAGKKDPPPDSNPFGDAEFGKNFARGQADSLHAPESPIPMPQRQSAFHPHAQ